MFVDEAEASLDALTSGLLTLEGGGNGGGLKSLLGTAHKIKGSAASIGLNRAAKLAHLMEDLFEKVVARGSSLSPQTADVLLKCADGLRQHVANLRGGGRGSDHFGPLARDLLAAEPKPEKGDGPHLPERPEGCPHKRGPSPFQPDAETAAARITYLGEVTFQPDLPTAGLKAQLIYEKLVKLGDVRDCQPSPERLDTIDHLDSFRFQVTTNQSADAVAGQVRVGGVLRASVEPLAAQPASAEPAVVKAEGPSPSPPPECSDRSRKPIRAPPQPASAPRRPCG